MCGWGVNAKNFVILHAIIRFVLIMSAILNIETATDVCSVCLSQDGEMKFSNADYKGRNHAAVLGGYVKDALDYARQCEIKLDAVAVSIPIFAPKQ